ncbi:MAG: response regulator [Phycisphaerae bacterium]
MNDTISVLLADDHAMVRDTLRDRLNRESDIRVLAVVADADAAIARACELKPDIVVLDIDMPGQVSFAAARSIKSQCPDTRIMFLSAFFHDSYIEDALAAGATGYVTKDEPPDVLITAIRRAVRGVAYFSPKVQGRIVVGTHGVQFDGAVRSRLGTLTPRESEIIRYIARGLSKKEIGTVMHISVKTVNRHCENLMTKLDIHDRVELTRFAIREGLAEA